MAKKQKTARTKRGAGSTRAEWDAFEKSVLGAPASRRSRSAATVPEDPVLQRLAERSRIVRARSAPLGNVVFLHGITGSDLAVSKGVGKPDSVWVSILSLVRGGMKRLRLAPDGSREADATLQVRPSGINKRFYGRAVLSLRAQWNVEPFAYDWRKDIDEASDTLAAFIQQRFGNEPVHLVAHSMGGLVARNFIRRHREQWTAMKDPGLARGGRLIMLGTPNYGSYAIVQVLNGADALLSRLERFDLSHNMNQLLEITNSFVGTYQLMPAFAKMQLAEQRLYERTTWGPTRGISQDHFNRALDFYSKLDVPANTDPERLTYVAGVNQATIGGVKILAPGQFEYEFTMNGDGRVPLALGPIEGVPTYYIDEIHGDLAKNEEVLTALDELLQKGATSQLSDTAERAIAKRGTPTVARSTRAYRSNDRAALDVLTEMAARTRRAGDATVLTEAEQQIAADAILNAAVSARSAPIVLPPPLPTAETSAFATNAKPRVTLRVGARFDEIQAFKAPLVVVGHYRGVKPVNAIGAVDRKLDGWLDRAIRRGMISGQVGETFFVPVRGKALAAQGVIVAGMGDYGSFKSSSLRRLMANVAQGASALQIREVGTVLIGAGEGGMTAELALRHLVEGFAAGLAELREEETGEKRLSRSTLWIVERNPQRFAALDRELQRLASETLLEDVKLEVVPATPAVLKAAKRKFGEQASDQFDRAVSRTGSRSQFDEVRLTIECAPDKGDGARRFTLSALTDRALVPVEQVEVSSAVVDDLARGLSEAAAPAAQQQLGRLLFRYLLPKSFESLFETDADIRLIVDPASAAFPWEMACLPTARASDEQQRFGTDRRLTRQFRSLLSGSVGLIPPRNEKLRALVIADPAPETEWQLPGARAEGQAVARLLRFANGQELGSAKGPLVKLDIEVHEFIGRDECDPLDLIARLTSGDYDLVHFAGHGDYSKDDPSKSGWVLSAQHFVTPRDIARSRQTPWLIVANACFSGVVNHAAGSQPFEEARRSASIAEAFMQLGVRNYLGTGWAVDDGQAKRFSLEFYEWLLFGNRNLSDALARARQSILAEGQGSTWGAYQLYGDPADRLLPRIGERTDGEVAACRKRLENNDENS
ncbi:MAG: CHAT domain-containing protein [Steroidobacteraceae bacterium]